MATVHAGPRRRSRRAVAVVLVASSLLVGVAGSAGAQILQPPPTSQPPQRPRPSTQPPAPQPSSGVPVPGQEDCRGGPITRLRCELASRATQPLEAVADQGMQTLVGFFVNGAIWVLGQIGGVITDTTSPRLTAPWFIQHYDVMVWLAAVVMLPMLAAAVIQALLRQDGAMLARAVAAVPTAFLLAGMAIALTQALIALTDGMSATIARGVGDDTQQFFGEVARFLSELSNPPGLAPGGAVTAPLFFVFISSLLVVIGAFGIWVELVLRTDAIYVAVLFLPLVFAAMIWPAATKYAKRLVEALVAVIVAKFVIVAIVSLAASGLAQVVGPDGLHAAIVGGSLLLLAALAPWMLLRMAPTVEAGVGALAARGLRGNGIAPSISPAQMVSRAMGARAGAGRAAAAGAGGAGAAGAVGGPAAAGAAMVASRRRQPPTVTPSGRPVGGTAAATGATGGTAATGATGGTAGAGSGDGHGSGNRPTASHGPGTGGGSVAPPPPAGAPSPPANRPPASPPPGSPSGGPSRGSNP